MTRRYLLEAVTLIVAAVLCATIANAVAGRERKLALVGVYPNALRIPAEPSLKPLPQIAAPAPPSVPAPVAPSIKPAAPAPATSPIITPSQAIPPPSSPPSKPVAFSVASPPPVQPPAAKIDISRFAAHPDQPWVEIAYDDVAVLHDAGVFFLDARRTSVYEQGHIPGARSVSVWESDVDDKVRRLFDERGGPREQAKPIVIYCSGGDCEDSHMLAQKLWGIQFNNVYVYKDGFPDWQKREGSVHTGSKP